MTENTKDTNDVCVWYRHSPHPGKDVITPRDDHGISADTFGLTVDMYTFPEMRFCPYCGKRIEIGPGPERQAAPITDLYSLRIGFEVDEDGWLAYVYELPGISAHGPTRDAALNELEVAFSLALEVAKEDGWKGWPGSFPTTPD